MIVEFILKVINDKKNCYSCFYIIDKKIDKCKKKTKTIMTTKINLLR